MWWVALGIVTVDVVALRVWASRHKRFHSTREYGKTHR